MICMLFDEDKVSSSLIDKWHLLEYAHPYKAEVKGVFGLDDCYIDLRLSIPQIQREIIFSLRRGVVQKLKEELGIGSVKDLLNREFMIYSQTKDNYDGIPWAFDPAKLETICCIEPYVGLPDEYEFPLYQKIIEAWQKYCDRDLDSDKFTPKDMGDYLTCKGNIFLNRRSADPGDLRNQRKAIAAFGALGKLGIGAEVANTEI